jgi:hypothetical protein
MGSSIKTDTEILECSHCGNRTPHKKVLDYTHPMLFDEIDNQRYLEDFAWTGYACATCGGLNLYGDFVKFPASKRLARSKLYPKGCDLLPPSPVLSPSDPIPEPILKIYEEVWPLRYRAPAAFVGQVKRLLALICAERGAMGATLFDQLQQLVAQEVFPKYFATQCELLRKVGEMGTRIPDEALNIWDADLANELFRAILEYVYVAPAKFQRLQQRMGPLSLVREV